MIRYVAMFSVLGIVLLLGSCGSDSSESQESTGASAATLPANLMLNEEPVGAISILALKAEKNVSGNDVVVTGRIGGRVAPFVEGRAMFTMIDLELPVCGLADPCKTPWDSCCETPETIKSNMITVQVVDEDGAIVKRGLDADDGLSPLDRITIQGTVSEQDGDLVLLDAIGIYVHADHGEMNIS